VLASRLPLKQRLSAHRGGFPEGLDHVKGLTNYFQRSLKNSLARKMRRVATWMSELKSMCSPTCLKLGLRIYWWKNCSFLSELINISKNSFSVVICRSSLHTKSITSSFRPSKFFAQRFISCFRFLSSWLDLLSDPWLDSLSNCYLPLLLRSAARKQRSSCRVRAGTVCN